MDVDHPRRPRFRGVVRQRDARLLPDPDEGELVLVHVRVDPDRGEIGDLVDRHSRLDPVPLEGHLLDHDARDRRLDRLIERPLPALLERTDLLVGEVPEPEALAAGAEKRPRAVERLRDVARAKPADGLAREEILLLRRDQLGAVDREQRVAFADRLARVVGEHVADVAVHLERHFGELPLVVVEASARPDDLLDGTARDVPVRDADRLLLTAVQADRCAGKALLAQGAGRGPEQREPDHEEAQPGTPHCPALRGRSPPTARSRSAYAFSKSASAW